MRPLQCPKCHSQNVSVQFVQTGAKTKTKGRSCLSSCLFYFCFGWLLSIFRRKKYKSTTTFENEKVVVCQNCGYQFKPRR